MGSEDHVIQEDRSPACCIISLAQMLYFHFNENPKMFDELNNKRKLYLCIINSLSYTGLIPQLIGVAPEKAIKLTVSLLLNLLFRLS